MKINKQTALLTLSMILGLAFSHQALGQDYYGQQDPFQNILNHLGQQQDQLGRQIHNQQQAMIDEYRRTYNDYETSDQAILQHIDRVDRRRNPRAYAIMDERHRTRIGNIRRAGDNARLISGTLSNINDSSMKGYNERSRSNEIAHRNYINNVWDRSRYANPSTGERVTLGWGELKHFHGNGINTYYTDGNQRQFQNNGGGNWQELDEIDR